MAQYTKVKIIRFDKREGLIRARIRGALAATAPTLTFLDSHVECSIGWLEPLLDRIARDPTNVACPVIEIIDDNTLRYIIAPPTHVQVGGFTWRLTFNWHSIPQSEFVKRQHPAEPVRSPTMAGGLFTIDAAFFKKLGMYDPEFEYWGSEHLELSFKTWMCGGTLEIIPCSHVGHIFRKKSPHKWTGGDSSRRNSIRLAEVWLDDYAKFFYMRTGFYKGDFGNISERVELRKNLGCKSFKWYLDNIYPEMKVPDNLGEGSIENVGIKNWCLDSNVSENDFAGTISMYTCHNMGANQFFEYTKQFEIFKEGKCLDFDNSSADLKMSICHNAKGNQQWIYNLTSNQFLHKAHNKCLGVDDSKKLMMNLCNESDQNQKWIFKYLYKEKFESILQ